MEFLSPSKWAIFQDENALLTRTLSMTLRFEGDREDRN